MARLALRGGMSLAGLQLSRPFYSSMHDDTQRRLFYRAHSRIMQVLIPLPNLQPIKANFKGSCSVKAVAFRLPDSKKYAYKGATGSDRSTSRIITSHHPNLVSWLRSPACIVHGHPGNVLTRLP